MRYGDKTQGRLCAAGIAAYCVFVCLIAAAPFRIATALIWTAVTFAAAYLLMWLIGRLMRCT